MGFRALKHQPFNQPKVSQMDTAAQIQPDAPMMDGGGTDGEDDDVGSKEIVISVMPDGSMTVGMEVDGQDQGEATPAKDIADALKQALMLYQGMQTGGTAQQGFDSVTPPKAAAPRSKIAASRGMA